MARMRDFEREAWAKVLGLEDDFTNALARRHGAPQAPADTPVTVDAALAAAPAPRENTMRISADLHDLAAKLEPIAEEDLPRLAAVMGSPVGSAVFAALHQLIGLNVDPATISEVAGGLTGLAKVYAPAQAQQPAA